MPKQAKASAEPERPTGRRVVKTPKPSDIADSEDGIQILETGELESALTSAVTSAATKSRTKPRRKQDARAEDVDLGEPAAAEAVVAFATQAAPSPAAKAPAAASTRRAISRRQELLAEEEGEEHVDDAKFVAQISLGAPTQTSAMEAEGQHVDEEGEEGRGEGDDEEEDGFVRRTKVTRAKTKAQKTSKAAAVAPKPAPSRKRKGRSAGGDEEEGEEGEEEARTVLQALSNKVDGEEGEEYGGGEEDDGGTTTTDDEYASTPARHRTKRAAASTPPSPGTLAASRAARAAKSLATVLNTLPQHEPPTHFPVISLYHNATTVRSLLVKKGSKAVVSQEALRLVGQGAEGRRAEVYALAHKAMQRAKAAQHQREGPVSHVLGLVKEYRAAVDEHKAKALQEALARDQALVEAIKADARSPGKSSSKGSPGSASSPASTSSVALPAVKTVSSASPAIPAHEILVRSLRDKLYSAVALLPEPWHADKRTPEDIRQHMEEARLAMSKVEASARRLASIIELAHAEGRVTPLDLVYDLIDAVPTTSAASGDGEGAMEGVEEGSGAGTAATPAKASPGPSHRIVFKSREDTLRILVAREMTALKASMTMEGALAREYNKQVKGSYDERKGVVCTLAAFLDALAPCMVEHDGSVSAEPHEEGSKVLKALKGGAVGGAAGLTKDAPDMSLVTLDDDALLRALEDMGFGSMQADGEEDEEDAMEKDEAGQGEGVDAGKQIDAEDSSTQKAPGAEGEEVLPKSLMPDFEVAAEGLPGTVTAMKELAQAKKEAAKARVARMTELKATLTTLTASFTAPTPLDEEGPGSHPWAEPGAEEDPDRLGARTLLHPYGYYVLHNLATQPQTYALYSPAERVDKCQEPFKTLSEEEVQELRKTALQLLVNKATATVELQAKIADVLDELATLVLTPADGTEQSSSIPTLQAISCYRYTVSVPWPSKQAWNIVYAVRTLQQSMAAAAVVEGYEARSKEVEAELSKAIAVSKAYENNPPRPSNLAAREAYNKAYIEAKRREEELKVSLRTLVKKVGEARSRANHAVEVVLGLKKALLHNTFMEYVRSDPSLAALADWLASDDMKDRTSLKKPDLLGLGLKMSVYNRLAVNVRTEGPEEKTDVAKAVKAEGKLLEECKRAKALAAVMKASIPIGSYSGMTIVAQPKRVKLTFEPNTLIATVGQPLPAFVVAPPETYTTADKVAAENERVRAENARAELMGAARSSVGLPHSKVDKAVNMRALPRPAATLTQVQALPGTLEVHLAYEIDSTPVPLDAGLPPYAPGPRVALVKRVTALERAAAAGASKDGGSHAASGGQLDEEDERRSVASTARSTLGTQVKEARKKDGVSRRRNARGEESASGAPQADVVLDSEGEEVGIPTRPTTVLRKGMNAALVTPPRPKSVKAATALATPPPAKRAKVSVPSPEAEEEAPALAVGGKAKAGPAQAKGVPQRRAPARAVNAVVTTSARKTGKVPAQGGKTAVLSKVLTQVRQVATQQASAGAGQEDDFVFEE